MWPNLNVQPQQYRFRVLAAANAQLYDLQLCVGDWNASNNARRHQQLGHHLGRRQQRLVHRQDLPFTLIGSDGGYLPAPQVVKDVQIGITERADLLVDFSQVRGRARRSP